VADNRPARAGTGCDTAPSGARRTTEGLPRDSGEASGFAASKQYPGAVWMIRDSGHPNELYALRFNPDGAATSRVLPVAGAENRDWEDVTRFERADGRSGLWIVESGQSGSNRFVYEVAEPDPDNDVVARATARFAYAYPDSKSNTEAAFTFDNKLVLVSKSFPARVYRFDKPLSTSGVNVPTLIGELSDSRGVSVAKPSPDHRWLATATHDTLFLYKNRGSGSLEDFLDREPFHAMVFAPEDNVEAGDFTPAFGDCMMLFASETRNTYRVSSQPVP
jgi:WD40 repeat protein